jgi:hypothetical protein
MAGSVYVGDMSSELADMRRLLIEQIRQAGLEPVILDERADDAGLRDRVRAAMRSVTAFITVVAFRRGWEPTSLNGQSLAEAEYEAARELGKPLAVLMPESNKQLSRDLRRLAAGQSRPNRDAQRAFMQRVQRESRVLWFADEADLSEQVAQILAEWSKPPEAPPAPPAGFFERWRQGMFDLDALADQIVERIQQKLWSMQNQPNLAEQAMLYQEALRLKPGELVFGKPLSSRQFQSDIFVIMPFASEFDPVYRGVIKPLMDDMQLRCVRGDEFASQRGSIIEEVWAALNNCRLVIADITGGNNNVFYELGIAHTLNKPAIILTQAETPEGVPFDIRHLRYITYRNTDEGRLRLHAELQAAITWLLSDLEESWGV